MTNDNEKFQNILSEALEHYENGKPITEILDLYPESRKELQEIFQTIQLLAREKEGAIPPKELLAKIISELQPVNESQKSKKVVIDSRGEIKGRPSTTRLESLVSLFTTMSKRLYIGLGLVIVALLVVGGLYWQSRKVAIPPAISPIESETSFEEKALEQDLAELEEFEKDKSLENLEQDLSEIAEEEVPIGGEKIEISSIENLEEELSSELSSFSSDLSDLETGFINDTSLDTLDSGLAGVAE